MVTPRRSPAATGPRPGRAARGVSFQNGDLVPVAGEQHPSGQAVEPAAHHDNLCHLSSLVLLVSDLVVWFGRPR